MCKIQKINVFLNNKKQLSYILTMIVKPPSTIDKPLKIPKQDTLPYLSAKMSELVTTDDGRVMNVAQAIADRVANIAMFAESNSDSIAAAKFIFETLNGKAGLRKQEDVKPMPKVIFALSDTGIDKISEVANENKEEGEAGVVVQIEDGEEMIV